MAPDSQTGQKLLNYGINYLGNAITGEAGTAFSEAALNAARGNKYSRFITTGDSFRANATRNFINKGLPAVISGDAGKVFSKALGGNSFNQVMAPHKWINEKLSTLDNATKLAKGEQSVGQNKLDAIKGAQDQQNASSLTLFKKGGEIRLNPKNKGKFTATKKRTGKTTEELTHSKNKLTRKRAIFAQNAKKWKHFLGGRFQGLATDNGIMISKDKNVSKNKPKIKFIKKREKNN